MRLLLFCLVAFLFAIVQSVPTYTVQQVQNLPNGLTATVQLTAGEGQYGNDIGTLKLDVAYETATRLHVKLTDKNNPNRWQVPLVVEPSAKNSKPNDALQYAFQLNQNPFSFSVKRLIDGEVLFNTTGLVFMYEDQFISLGTQLPTYGDAGPNIYGLGERIHALRLDPNNKIYTMFARDHGNAVDTNLYGHHPFYMELRQNGNCHGVFFLNSNAQDVWLNYKNGQRSLFFDTIGGVLDMYFFMGPTCEAVVQQYQQVIGTPFLPPYYALGWHQCRWGYLNLNNTRAVVENYKKYSIPLDAIWNDIDFFDGYKDFTTDPVNFPGAQVKQFIEGLHETNQHYVVITDPAIKIENGYDVFEDGVRRDVFMRGPDGNFVVNKVWPGLTVFPDFSKQETINWWGDQLTKFYQTVPVSGLWIDMNEPAGFCNGQCTELSPAKYRDATNPGFNPLNPPYVPGLENLNDQTVRLDATTNMSLFYNTHDLYGFLEARATQIALEKITGKRTFIISRSTFAGNSKFATGHWLGDNYSSFQSMATSIPGILNFNIFGIPLVGADICGFAGDSYEELCTRWMQLGSFYPFSRNHNSINQRPQEPYAFGPKLAEISRQVLLNRYSLLPYYYTLFYKAHLNGGTVARPVFFEFPKEQAIVQYIDRQFLIGPALLVSPVMNDGDRTVYSYFPNAKWYDYWTGAAQNTRQQWVTLQAPIETINVHIRGGYILPRQEPALTTKDTRANPFWLLVALDDSNSATGELIIDDGESLDSVSSKSYTSISYVAAVQGGNGSIRSTFGVNGYAAVNKMSLSRFVVYGVPSNVCTVTVDGQAVESSKFSYDGTLHVLSVHDLTHNMGSDLAVSWTSC